VATATDALTTDRLLLERFAPEHAAALGRLASIPEMMRFIGPGGVWPPERVAEVATRQVEHWRHHGFGWRVALERESGAHVGFMGLNFLGEGTAGLDPTDYEIGWWVAREHWGRGYATEGGAALRDHAFADLGAPGVVARIRPENQPSIDVALRLGLSYEFDTTGSAGEPCSIYRLERPRA
jgi:RimJ/RimL family protein N-acetyltransferase